MEFVSILPKPKASSTRTCRLARARPSSRSRRQARRATPPNPNQLSYTNSDLAFKDSHVVVGNYHGFNTYNIERANKPQLIASVVCPGGQGDVSI